MAESSASAAGSVQDDRRILILPDGVASLYLTDDTCKIIDIDKRTATDGSTFKIPKQIIMEDIQMRGAISDFHPVKPQLQAYNTQEILMRYNPEDKYGDSTNFEICVTEVGPESIQKEITAPAAFKTELKKKEPKLWIHLGSDQEIADEQVHTSRDLIAVRATKKRKDFGAPIAFSDRDAMETFSSGQMECRPFKDPAYDKSLVEQDVGIQSIPITQDCSSQTNQEVFRNNCVQYQPRSLSKDNSKIILDSEHMCGFLDSAKPRYVDALQQNEVMDLFEDDFGNFGEEDEQAGQKTISVITEFQAFSDLTYSKGKMISAIDWMPGKKGVVAAACSHSRAYDERLQFSGKPSNSYVLIWSFVDPIRPQIILESLSDIFSLRFNHSDSRFVGGGCYNGQVIIWDITVAQMHMEAKEKESSDELDQGKDKERKKAPIVICHLLSSAAKSHDAIVSDIHWLPHSLQLEANGEISKGHSLNTTILVSVGADGKVIFWNITHADLQRDTVSDDDQKLADHANQKYTWSPSLQVDLAGGNPSRKFGLLKLSIATDSRFFCSTEFGEVLRADLNASKTKLVEEVSQSHFGQVRSLHRSPFYEDILLSVDIWTFALWKDEFPKPIFISRSAEGYLTTGCWSPSRPGVLYIGRIDGSIEVWDLIDHSHQPSALASIGSCQVTTMEFWPLQSPQMLAVGDIQGVLHIMEIPRRLRRMVHREKSMVRKFLDRQQSWVEDVECREKDRLQEIEKRQKHERDQKERDEQLLLCAEWDEKRENEYLAFENECRLLLNLGENASEISGKTAHMEQ